MAKIQLPESLMVFSHHQQPLPPRKPLTIEEKVGIIMADLTALTAGVTALEGQAAAIVTAVTDLVAEVGGGVSTDQSAVDALTTRINTVTASLQAAATNDPGPQPAPVTPAPVADVTVPTETPFGVTPIAPTVPAEAPVAAPVPAEVAPEENQPTETPFGQTPPLVS